MANEHSHPEENGSMAMKELDEVFEDLVTLLKNPDVVAALTARGINTSLALVGAEGLMAYVHGDKGRAVEDLSTVAEEIAARAAGMGGEAAS